jgi:hypothetical protein
VSGLLRRDDWDQWSLPATIRLQLRDLETAQTVTNSSDSLNAAIAAERVTDHRAVLDLLEVSSSADQCPSRRRPQSRD